MMIFFKKKREFKGYEVKKRSKEEIFIAISFLKDGGGAKISIILIIYTPEPFINPALDFNDIYVRS